jgi:hypothetical protein
MLMLGEVQRVVPRRREYVPGPGDPTGQSTPAQRAVTSEQRTLPFSGAWRRIQLRS